MTERVAILIDGKKFEGWSEVELTLSLDTFATCSFKSAFDATNAELRSVFRPFSFKPLKILVNDEVLFTGSLVGVSPQYEAGSSVLDVTGYALPAVLDDCTAPGSTVPHEFKKLGLKAIALALAGPFGIGVEFRDGEGSKIEKAKLDEEKTIFAFLTELAQQRNLVLSNTPEGVLLCWKSVSTGNPVAIVIDEPPLTTISATFNPQQYFSEITGFGKQKRGRKGSKHTEKNKWLPGVLRPSSFKLEDTDPADVPEATRARLGRMFAGMASWTIDNIPTWRSPPKASNPFEPEGNPAGDLWKPNTTVMIEAPAAMVYRKTELLIRNVTFKQSAESESATLEVVLPGAFSGEVPQFLPWEEPL